MFIKTEINRKTFVVALEKAIRSRPGASKILTKWVVNQKAALSGEKIQS